MKAKSMQTIEGVVIKDRECGIDYVEFVMKPIGPHSGFQDWMRCIAPIHMVDSIHIGQRLRLEGYLDQGHHFHEDTFRVQYLKTVRPDNYWEDPWSDRAFHKPQFIDNQNVSRKTDPKSHPETDDFDIVGAL